MYDGIKVFTATKARDREMLGDMATEWLRKTTSVKVVDQRVVQSSDAEFHCLSIIIFYQTETKAIAKEPGRSPAMRKLVTAPSV